jgi:hypothetical protein
VRHGQHGLLIANALYSQIKWAGGGNLPAIFICGYAESFGCSCELVLISIDYIEIGFTVKHSIKIIFGHAIILLHCKMKSVFAAALATEVSGHARYAFGFS